MGQIVTNKTGRVKINSKGIDPEIKIFAKVGNEGFYFDTEINLDSKHKFRDDYRISIQPYEKNGIALPPLDMGSVGKPSDLGKIFVKDINIDRALFRLRVTGENKILKGLADHISIFTANTNKGKQNNSEYSNTLLPVKETDNLRVPFAIEMNEGDKPVLLLKSKLGLKEKFKNDIIIKTLIYTSVIKEILYQYLTNLEYINDPIKKKFIDAIVNNSGGDITYPDEENFLDDGKITEIGHKWIEEAVDGCINKTVTFHGENTSYMKKFSEKIKLSDYYKSEDSNED